MLFCDYFVFASLHAYGVRVTPLIMPGTLTTKLDRPVKLVYVPIRIGTYTVYTNTHTHSKDGVDH